MSSVSSVVEKFIADVLKLKKFERQPKDPVDQGEET